MKGAVANARMKKSKVMKKSSKSKNSLTPSTQKKATRKPAKLICSVTRQELVITTNDSVIGLQEEMIRAELDSKGPPTPPPSPGRGGSIHDNTN